MTAHPHTTTTQGADPIEPADPVVAPAAIVAVAWPTGRPVFAYTRAELAAGVDLYTRALKARAAATPTGDRHAAAR